MRQHIAFGGGQTVLFSGSGDSVDLSAGNGDAVIGSNGTVNLTNAQASISGGGDAVNLIGTSSNAVGLWHGAKSGLRSIAGAARSI